MPFLIMQNWEKMNRDIWNSLEKLASAPPDVYVELLRSHLLHIGREEIEKPENVEVLNDSAKSREAFRSLPSPANEARCVSTLGEYYRILRQFGTEIAEKYREKLIDWIAEHNLRYVVTGDCELKLSIPGSLVSQFEFLKNSLATNPHRTDSIHDIEKTLSKLDDPSEVRNFIRSTSNLLEGIVIDSSSGHGNTLTRALPGCRSKFPHQYLIDCVQSVYDFCSDYTNLRHSGNPASSIRNLKKDDALLMLAITIGFGTFIVDNDASDKILSGDL